MFACYWYADRMPSLFGFYGLYQKQKIRHLCQTMENNAMLNDQRMPLVLFFCCRSVHQNVKINIGNPPTPPL